ncbi:MAG: mutY [Chitinophagaceae bacterium]|nr:mutY [Chitinophagaceae bacterium]
MERGKFRQLLLEWNDELNNRKMPWKGEKDPYKIWLSEVILQQTRVEQGTAYYHKFIQKYPTISSLAAAKDEEAFKLWEGLGYYSRCRNLLFAARTIVSDFDGTFPSTYDQILALKGIGNYTAAAIASFAFNQPYAVVDGNVYRVLSRVFGIFTPIDSIAGKKEFAGLASSLLDKKDPGNYNQAIMDFGATVCTPAPNCDHCSLSTRCFAFIKKATGELPVKEKKTKQKERWFSYFIFRHKDHFGVYQRTSKDIWQQLHEFYLYEHNAETKWTVASVKKSCKNHFDGSPVSSVAIRNGYRQQLTHQRIHGHFIMVELNEQILLPANGIWMTLSEMKKRAFPRMINEFIGREICET